VLSSTPLHESWLAIFISSISGRLTQRPDNSLSMSSRVGRSHAPFTHFYL